MPPPLVKVCVLGSSAVGKSTLTQQFAHNQFEEQEAPTPARGAILHCPSSLNGKIYHLQLLDMPAIKEFPATSLAEWTEFQHTLLRSAHAYIFVFDLTTPSTFYYVKVLRDQLFESRNMQNVPVWVVGNKADQCMNVLATMRGHRHDHHHHHQRASNLLHSSQHQAACPYEDLTPAFKDLANLVRKQWKCSYLECSAKYNWRVVPIFREIVKSLETSLPAPDAAPVQPSQTASQRESHFRSASIRVVANSHDGTTSQSQSPPPPPEPRHESESVCRIV